jgi:colicin import membrane protein
MTARSPGAIFLSVLLHGAVATLLLAFAWIAQRRVPEQPQIFELVAGPGDNYSATVAPASGSPAIDPLVKTMDRAASNSEQRVLKKEELAEKKAQQLAEAEALRANSNPKPDKTSVVAASTLPIHPVPNKSVSSPPKAPKPLPVTHINTEQIINGVANGSPDNRVGGAGGSALSRPDAGLSEAYLAMLRLHVRNAFAPPDGLTQDLQAEVEFILNADGTVTGARIITPSGNPAFDRAVLAAFRTMIPLPPPPSGRSTDYRIPFKMRDDV